MDTTPPDAWLQQAACADLRDPASHAALRPRGAVALEIDDLLYRPYLLPPRSQPLVLVGGSQERMPLVVQALRAAGHADVRHFPAASWQAHLAAESGPPTRTRLWEPSPAVPAALAMHPLPAGSSALDLACGAGRNAVYLALCGFQVTAIDILPDALARVRDLAARCGVEVNCVQRDLQFPGAMDDLNADLVLVVRYLDRSVFSPLQRAVRPGGMLVYETFTAEQAETGHPRNPKFLLERDELRHAFPDLQTLFYREGYFDGAHLARLVATAAGAGPGC
jgi:tellurite methyltransferase